MKKEKREPEHPGMHKGASGRIFRFANRLRRKMTEPEKLLWERLRRKKLGYKFRRQHPVIKYIADFYCHEKKLIVEVDGGYHETEKQKILDNRRTQALAEVGISVIRFSNEEVSMNLDGVVERIIDELANAGPLAP